MRSQERLVAIPCGHRRLEGILHLPASPAGVVVFAHGSGSGRHSPRNRFVAEVLQQAGLGTLLLDLLEEEEADDRRKVFDIDLLAERLQAAADWLQSDPAARELPLGYFGASTGAGAALVAAARHPDRVAAVVSRGGRPDLAGSHLANVQAPTLLIVGGADDVVLDLNRRALELMNCPRRLAVVPGATHLFPEPGALEHAAHLARDWFLRYLPENDEPEEEDPPYGFQDRRDAGKRLARALIDRDLVRPVVLGIPRGGVVVAAEVARALGADLDVALARKLRAPYQPELAIGAISEDGEVFVEPHAWQVSGVDEAYIKQEARRQLGEIQRRKELFRAVRPALDLRERSVLVVDDGIATGATMIAALQMAKHQQPRERIVAVPVASTDRLEEVARHADDAVCLLEPEGFMAIGPYYRDFTQVEDEEVVALLREFASERSGNTR